MNATGPLDRTLPSAASGAVQIVQRLTDAGHRALLAGGCVRDLLLGHEPQDYDVATDATPERVCALFRATRRVGAQFGVVLVKKSQRWVEVATFRSDGPYLDGRHPSSVTLTDARHDAYRRDFTVNGMFLDPLRNEVLDYVGGRRDLDARTLRAIGDPDARFAEDYLRLLRAVRFSARLDFPIEPRTLAAIRKYADRLRGVAAERVREELERMFRHPRRQSAWHVLGSCGLRNHLWPDAGWTDEEIARIDAILARLSDDAGFELTLAVLLAERDPRMTERVARSLTLSNDQTRRVTWLVSHQADLDDPGAPTLAELKRLMQNRAFPALRQWAVARHQDAPDAEARTVTLDKRIAAIRPDAVKPPPLVRGDDIQARGIRPGPVFADVLNELYTRQLDEELCGRDEALTALDELLAERRGNAP